MLKKIAIGIFVICSFILIYAAFQPEEYLIRREIVINAKADAIFPHLVSMKKADAWMPWKDVDPQVVSTYSGPDEGVGSTTSWESTGQMGTGKSEIIEVTHGGKVTTQISYSKPMEMVQVSQFILTSLGDSTKMEWNVKGRNNYFFRLIGIIMCMDTDKYVGGEFEKGLNKLKVIVEKK